MRVPHGNPPHPPHLLRSFGSLCPPGRGDDKKRSVRRGNVFPFVIAGLDPAIHAGKRLAHAAKSVSPHVNMDHRVTGEPTGPARSGRPDDKLRDAVLRAAMPGGDKQRKSCGEKNIPADGHSRNGSGCRIRKNTPG